jgi:HlyD family secretion protein
VVKSPVAKLSAWGLAFILAGCSLQKPPQNAVSGTIEVDEARVASRYGGRVEAVLASEGQELKGGDPVVRLQAPELAARMNQLSSVLAELKAGARKEELVTAKNEWEAFTAELEFARSEERRVRELFDQAAVPEAERDRATSRAASLAKSAAAAKSRYDLLVAGTRPERIAQVEAQLVEVRTQLAEMSVTAPTNSILEVLHVKLGDVVGPNREIATLIFPQHTWVRVYVPEPWLGHLKLGQEVQVEVDSFPGKPFRGEIEQIARAAEFTPRNVQTVSERVKQVFGVKVRLPKAGDELRPGMAADVYFPNLPQSPKK